MLACAVPKLETERKGKTMPDRFVGKTEMASSNSGTVQWKTFFQDPNLIALIDTALVNNQDLNITLQEIEIAKNEVKARKGAYLPFVTGGAATGFEKVGRYTTAGANEAHDNIVEGTANPPAIPNVLLGGFASWEVDIWHKLRNSRKAAVSRYLATVEGRNFVITNLIAEIANSYYELMASDNELDIIRQNIKIQTNALETVKAEKEATRVTELAVKRFEAQVLHTQSMQYNIEQRIVEIENQINFLIGSYPKPVSRSSAIFSNNVIDTAFVGLPAQLLENRPDIRQSQLNLAAAKLDVLSAKANFYPSLNLSASLGLNAFSPTYLFKGAESIIYSLSGGLMGPLVNKNAIKAQYLTANARQIQAIYDFQRTSLNAVKEVANQVSNFANLAKSYKLKEGEVNALSQSVAISGSLFRSARADYVEVLLTQRDAQESKFQLVEIKLQQLKSKVNLYRSLGGGWN